MSKAAVDSTANGVVGWCVMRPSQLPDTVDDIVVWDVESSGLHPDDGATVSTIAVAYREGGVLQAWAFPFDQGPVSDKVRKASLFDEQDSEGNLPEQEWRALMAWLARQALVAHNAKFDLLMTQAGTRQWVGADLSDNVVWDTELASWVLDPLAGKGLDDNAERHLHDDSKERTRKALKPYLGPVSNPRYDLVPIGVMSEYARSDALLEYRLWEHQQQRLNSGEDHLRPIIQHELDVMQVLFRMEQRGIGYDLEGSRRAEAEARKLLQRCIDRLPFRPTPNEASNWFTRQGAIPHCVTAKGGRLSVGECCVRTFIEQGIAGAREWSQYTKIDHAIGKYFAGYADRLGKDGRLRTSFQQAGTITFRFSSQRVNLQALPHDYRLEALEGVASPRSLFRAKPGHQLWEMDLSQAELRRGAKVAGCQSMLQLIEAGEDLHDDTCRKLFGIDKDSPLWFERRQTTKRCNFGLIYQVGPDTFQRDLEKHTGIKISRHESETIVRNWRDLYPEFPAINRRAEQKARTAGFIRLVGGRLRWFQPYEELHKAFNAKIQGDIAELMKLAMVKLDRDWPGTLLLQIHDSLVVELPATEADDLAREMSRSLSEVATATFGVLMTSDVKRWKEGDGDE